MSDSQSKHLDIAAALRAGTSATEALTFADSMKQMKDAMALAEQVKMAAPASGFALEVQQGLDQMRLARDAGMVSPALDAMRVMQREMDMKRAAMDAIIAQQPSSFQMMSDHIRSMHTTSDKIRALAAASVPRAEIARMLDIRYQHVRNVLVRDENKAEAVENEASPAPAEAEKPSAGGLLRGKIGPAGRIVIPAPVREALGLEEGTEVVFTLEGDEVRIATMRAHLRRLQARVREMIPEGVSLVDELIADRRREQEDEDKK